MGSYWVDDLLEILSGAGVPFGLNSINAGWERRSRSSGGFDAAPLGVQFHHTASKASVDSDLSYMITGSPDRPVGNVLIDRVGIWWPIAAGAANTSGKGGPAGFSRGVCESDKGNTRLWSLEIANNGVGETYPAAQIDSAFAGSNALNAYFGNRPDDVIPHSLAEGSGYTDRKIDPATTNVQGSWHPRSVNSSGTWSHADLKAECLARAGTLPPPPPDDEEDEMLFDGFWKRDNHDAVYEIFKDGTKVWLVHPEMATAARNLWAIRGAPPESLDIRVQPDSAMFAAFGVVVGPRPAGVDEWGNP